MVSTNGKDKERLLLANIFHSEMSLATGEIIQALDILCKPGQPWPWDILSKPLQI